jgi:hypothetical protein
MKMGVQYGGCGVGKESQSHIKSNKGRQAMSTSFKNFL